MNVCKDGIYPAMITPFDKDNKIDYSAVKELIDWYSKMGCQGIFATCQSSEIFFLTAEERLELSKFVLENAPKEMDIVISGHVDDEINDQIVYLKEAAKLKPKALVLITNRLAKSDENEEIIKTNISRILEEVPDVNFGLYECPYPFLRLVSPELLKWCADTGRFIFMKDVSCDSELISKKLAAVKGTPLKIFNAHSVTLLDSIKHGASGLCGVLPNFHPDFYVKMFEYTKTDMKKAERMQNILGAISSICYPHYPDNSKYYLQLVGLNIKTTLGRTNNFGELPQTDKTELEQCFNAAQYFCKNMNNLIDE